MDFKLRHSVIHSSDEDLIADLKRVAQELDKKTVSKSDYDKHGNFSSATYLRRFDGWKNALSKASLEKGLPMNYPAL